MEMSTSGDGFLNYFTDSSWLWGRSNYNIVLLDDIKSMVVYGCDHFFGIYRHEYFWVLSSKPIVEYNQ